MMTHHTILGLILISLQLPDSFPKRIFEYMSHTPITLACYREYIAKKRTINALG